VWRGGGEGGELVAWTPDCTIELLDISDVLGEGGGVFRLHLWGGGHDDNGIEAVVHRNRSLGELGLRAR
jgi:hypothetical protein